MKRIVVIIILLVDIILLEGCKKSAIPLGNGDFNSFHFNDYLTSLDKGENDSLLIGTANGKLIVFDPKTSANYSRHVGNERVYFSYQHTSGFFVGIRNEGLKWYLKDGSLKKQFKLAGKDTQYSVYNVEKYHDTLFCATSSGLCLIDLNKIDSDSLLTLVYPKLSPNHEAPDDFKIDPIQCIQDTLYAAYSQDSTTKLLVFPIYQGSIEEPRSYSSDKIESFYVRIV